MQAPRRERVEASLDEQTVTVDDQAGALSRLFSVRLARTVIA